MTTDSKEVIEAQLSTLRHIKAFIDLNIRARKEEIEEIKLRGKVRK